MPDSFINLIPTDIQGLTFSRTPAQVIRIVTAGNPNSVGGFFPQGLLGAINSSSTYNVTSSGTGEVLDSLLVPFKMCQSQWLASHFNVQFLAEGQLYSAFQAASESILDLPPDSLGATLVLKMLHIMCSTQKWAPCILSAQLLTTCCCSADTPPAGFGVASQEALTTFGTIMTPINGDTPASLPQEYDLTQALGGTLENSSYLTRGYLTAAPLPANDANTSVVQVR